MIQNESNDIDFDKLWFLQNAIFCRQSKRWKSHGQEDPKLNPSRLRSIVLLAVKFVKGTTSIPLTDEERGTHSWKATGFWSFDALRFMDVGSFLCVFDVVFYFFLLLVDWWCFVFLLDLAIFISELKCFFRQSEKSESILSIWVLAKMVLTLGFNSAKSDFICLAFWDVACNAECKSIYVEMAHVKQKMCFLFAFVVLVWP